MNNEMANNYYMTKIEEEKYNNIQRCNKHKKMIEKLLKELNDFSNGDLKENISVIHDLLCRLSIIVDKYEKCINYLISVHNHDYKYVNDLID